MPISLIITVGLTLDILAVAAGLTARSHSARPLVRGIGLAAIPVGYYLVGFTDLTINGVVSLIDWLQRTVFTNVTAWGIGLLVGGIAIFALGALLPRRSRPAVEEGKAPAKPAAPPRPAARPVEAGPAARPGTPATPPPAAKPTGKPAQQKGLDAEDAEIEALLRKRGIM